MKLDYDLTHSDDYVDLWVYYAVRQREWQMQIYRDRETLVISRPTYLYSPNRYESFEDVPRVPKRVQDYFDAAMPKARTLLILGSD